MKRILLLVLIVAGFSTKAQNLETAGGYLDYIGKQQENITKKYLSYNSAVSHGKKARKVEKLREKLINEVQESRENIASMGKFKGDGEYKDSAVNFMKFYYNVLNDDYSKIINMEDIAEQSYDAMEAYIMLQEAIDKKMDEANDRISAAQKVFAGKNNIHLIDSKDDISEMMKKVSGVNQQYHKIYLIFFKPYMQESYLLTAIEKGNVNAIEQDKNALAKYAQEAVIKLDSLPAFAGDGAVRSACKQLLQFYIKEANEKMKMVSEFFIVKERFESIKKEFEKKDEHSKADVDAYNKGVNDMNASNNAYNSNNKALYEQRSDFLKNWNKAVDDFFYDETPKYK
jgi:hypothetical protein